MSSRALRKAQREREEQERLQRMNEDEREDSEEDTAAATQAKKSAFAMLAEDDEESEDMAVNEDVDEEQEQQAEPSASVPKPSGNRKKKKKKKGKGNKTSTPQEASEQDDEMDEIDKALRDLSTNGNASLPATTVSGIDQETNELCKLLSIDSSNLHAQNEMRRLFGRAALEQQEEEEPPNAGNAGGNRRQQRQVQRIGLAQALRGQGPGGRGGALSQMALKRNIFVQGKEEWPNATSGGLGMEVEAKRADGTVLYRFVHNRAYQEVQSQFAIAVESMDPNRLVVMLQQNPYHVSTLLQVSEIAKQDRENAMSGDLLERALFTFGRAVHSTFAKNLSEGKARLDFRRSENREFWLAGWRYMQNLTMRATWRTVYEWAKLLLSLSPDEDPYGMLLVLDQYALRSRQDLDYLNLAKNPTFKPTLNDIPGSHLSQALAESRAGNQGKGKQALYTAVGRYPWVIARLMQELNQQPPPAIWGKEPRTDREKLHSELYVFRAKDLWNTPEASELLLEVSSALPPDTPPAPPDEGEITLAEARHVLLSDTPSLTALIPRHFTAQLTSSSDPLPPSDGFNPPNSTEQSQRAMDEELAYLTQNLASLLPSAYSDQEAIERELENVGPAERRRILEAARRLEGLQRERLGVAVDGLEDGVRRFEDGDDEGMGRRARVEDDDEED